MLLNRQTPYRGDGTHDLLVNIGGSAGHGKLLAVHIEEGVINSEFKGRTWNVTTKSLTEAKQDRATDREKVKQEEGEEEELGGRHKQRC